MMGLSVEVDIGVCVGGGEGGRLQYTFCPRQPFQSPVNI
jgi:hypothetical protein